MPPQCLGEPSCLSAVLEISFGSRPPVVTATSMIFLATISAIGSLRSTRSERAQRKRVRLVQPLDLIRLQHVFRKKAIDRYGVSPTASMQKSLRLFCVGNDKHMTLIRRFGGAFLCRELVRSLPRLYLRCLPTTARAYPPVPSQVVSAQCHKFLLDRGCPSSPRPQ